MIKQIVISRRECKKEDAGVEIVVTGATSFLARPLVGRLLTMGHQVYAVVRPGSSNLELLKKEAGDNPGLRLVELEMDRFDSLDSVIGRSCGLFFHFGWDGSGSENRKNAVVQRRNAENSVKAFLAGGDGVQPGVRVRHGEAGFRPSGVFSCGAAQTQRRTGDGVYPYAEFQRLRTGGSRGFSGEYLSEDLCGGTDHGAR